MQNRQGDLENLTPLTTTTNAFRPRTQEGAEHDAQIAVAEQEEREAEEARLQAKEEARLRAKEEARLQAKEEARAAAEEAWREEEAWVQEQA